MIGCDAPDCVLEWFHFEVRDPAGSDYFFIHLIFSVSGSWCPLLVNGIVLSAPRDTDCSPVCVLRCPSVSSYVTTK